MKEYSKIQNLNLQNFITILKFHQNYVKSLRKIRFNFKRISKTAKFHIHKIEPNHSFIKTVLQEHIAQKEPKLVQVNPISPQIQQLNFCGVTKLALKENTPQKVVLTVKVTQNPSKNFTFQTSIFFLCPTLTPKFPLNQINLLQNQK